VAISNLNKKLHEGILRNGEIFLIKNHYGHVYLDGSWMRVEESVSFGGHC